jgi:hypothetical protein
MQTNNDAVELENRGMNRCDNKQVSKLLLPIVYPILPASGYTGQGYAKVCASTNQLDAFQ